MQHAQTYYCSPCVYQRAADDTARSACSGLSAAHRWSPEPWPAPLSCPSSYFVAGKPEPPGAGRSLALDRTPAAVNHCWTAGVRRTVQPSVITPVYKDHPLMRTTRCRSSILLN